MRAVQQSHLAGYGSSTRDCLRVMRQRVMPAAHTAFQLARLRLSRQAFTSKSWTCLGCREIASQSTVCPIGWTYTHLHDCCLGNGISGSLSSCSTIHDKHQCPDTQIPEVVQLPTGDLPGHWTLHEGARGRWPIAMECLGMCKCMACHGRGNGANSIVRSVGGRITYVLVSAAIQASESMGDDEEEQEVRPNPTLALILQ